MATKETKDKTITEVAEGIVKKYKKKGGALAPSEIQAVVGARPQTTESLGLNPVDLPYVVRCAGAGHRTRRPYTDGKHLYCPVCGEIAKPV